MKSIYKLGILNYLIIFSPLAFSLSGQVTPASTKLTADFKFKDGIYLTFDQVRANNPVPVVRLSIANYYNNLNSQNLKYLMEEILSDRVFFTDDKGNKHVIKSGDVIGLACGGNLYLKKSGCFNSIDLIGSISAYIVDIDNLYSGYMFNDREKVYQINTTREWNPRRDPSAGGNFEIKGKDYDPVRGWTNYGYDKGHGMIGSSTIYLLDFMTGRTFKSSIKNLKILLIKDPSIYAEYLSLSREKKKKMMFDYIDKFNRKIPLYLSEK